MAKVDRNPTQNELILAYIKKHGSITQLDASQKLGVMRLASRMSFLKGHGYPVVSVFEEVKNRRGKKCHIKRYSLKGGAGCQM